MVSLEFLPVFLRHGATTISKSTAVGTLQWTILILLASWIVLLSQDGPPWAAVALFVLLCVAVVLFCFAYICLMFRNPDALRSERYVIRKMEIEKCLIGDNLSGRFPDTDLAGLKQLPASSLLDAHTEGEV